MSEIWKPSRNFPGYSVSNKGRIRSELREMVRSNGWPHTIPEKMISATADTNGHLQFHPYKGKKRHHVFVHREVFETFVRPLELGEQVDHMDSNKKNNVIENLQAVANQTEHWKFTWERIVKEHYDAGYAAALEDVKKLQIS